MSGNPQAEIRYIQPAPFTLKEFIVRAIVYVMCVVICCAAARFLLIEGTIADEDVDVNRWRKESEDIFGAQNAIDRARFPEAKFILRNLLKKQPNFGRAHELLGYVLLQEDKLEEALTHYETAALYQPDIGRIERAIALIRERRSKANKRMEEGR